LGIPWNYRNLTNPQFFALLRRKARKAGAFDIGVAMAIPKRSSSTSNSCLFDKQDVVVENTIARSYSDPKMIWRRSPNSGKGKRLLTVAAAGL
jgi:hypothetical protein